MALVRGQKPIVVITDYRMPGMDGLELLREIKAFDPNIQVILISGHADMKTAVRALKEAAFDFQNKPLVIKDLLAAVDQAAERLGWTWEFEGRVAPGEGRGGDLGFPTANIALDGRLHPGPGIYAVRAGVVGRDGVDWHDGAAYIGSRPTFGGETGLLETNLFNFDGDLYGRRLRVAFVKRVRKDQSFEGVEALKAQMTADCQRARHILADAAGIARPISNPPAA